MSSLHLGVYVGEEGAAALLDEQLVERVFEERTISRMEAPLTRYSGPGGSSAQGLIAWGTAVPPLPRESIRACLRGLSGGWSKIKSVTVVGPRGSLERFESEYAPHQGFSEVKLKGAVSAQASLAQLAIYELGLREGLSVVMSSELTGVDLSSYALYQTRDAATQALFKARSAGQMWALKSPVLTYQALVERARRQLKVGHDHDHHPLQWASQLASSSTQPLPQLKRWFSATPNSFEIKVSSYDMWLEVLCIERRFTNESSKRSSSQLHLRSLWAALIAKAQRELGESLRAVISHLRREAGALPIIFTGDLALDPTLAQLLQSDEPRLASFTSSLSSPAGLAIGASLIGAVRAERRLPVLQSPLSQRSYPKETLIEQSLKQLRPPLSAQPCEPVELGKRFARKLLRGGVLGYFEGPPPIGAAPQLSRLCLIDPSGPRAAQQLNATLERDLDCPTYLICPAQRVPQLFHNPPEHLSSQLSLCAPLKTLHEALSPALRADGLAPLLALDPKRSPLLAELCEALSLHFNRPPVLLAAPLTLSSGQLVTHPSDALHALSSRSLDALLIGSTWVESALSPQVRRAHQVSSRPHTLDAMLPEVLRDFRGELVTLDQLIFDPERLSVEWDIHYVKQLSRELAPYREESRLFDHHPLLGPLRDEQSLTSAEGLSFLVNPHGMTRVIDSEGRWPTRLYPWAEAATLLSLRRERRLQEARLSLHLHLPPRDRAALISWGLAELEALGARPHPSWRPALEESQANIQLQGEALLAPFQDPKFNLRAELRALWSSLKGHGYREELIAPFRGDEPPRALTQQPSDLLVRLFWLGEPLSRAQLLSLLGERVMTTLIELGVLVGKEGLRSQVKLDCVSGAIIASDQSQGLSRVGAERHVPPLTAHERGLVRLGLARRGGRTLDASETLGGVAITQARITRPIDLLVTERRAYRFTHFNLQLNGVEPSSLELTPELKISAPHLYNQVYTRSRAVLREASAYLKPRGRLIMLTEDIIAASRAPVSVMHRALGLPLHAGPVALDDPRLYQGFEGHTGYWVIEHRDGPEADQVQRGLSFGSATLHRPLKAFPCEQLHEYIDHYFMPPLKDQELAYPHPSLNLIKESRSGDEKRFSVSNERWPSLSSLMILDEVYAHLKSLMVQRQASPITMMSSELVRLGLNVIKRRLSASL